MEKKSTKEILLMVNMTDMENFINQMALIIKAYLRMAYVIKVNGLDQNGNNIKWFWKEIITI